MGVEFLEAREVPSVTATQADTVKAPEADGHTPATTQAPPTTAGDTPPADAAPNDPAAHTGPGDTAPAAAPTPDVPPVDPGLADMGEDEWTEVVTSVANPAAKTMEFRPERDLPDGVPVSTTLPYVDDGTPIDQKAALFGGFEAAAGVSADAIAAAIKRYELYGPRMKPDWTDVKQGGIGDCWFLAGLAAYAKRNPAAIESMIKPLGNNQYQVTFPQYPGNPVTIFYDPGAGGANAIDPKTGVGIWVRVIEQAAAQLFIGGKFWRDVPGVPFNEKLSEVLPGGVVARLTGPGDGSVSMELFTGKPGQMYTLTGTTAALTFKLTPLGRLFGGAAPTPSWLELLELARKGGKLVTATTVGGNKNGLFGNHVYTVVGYDPKTGMVKLRNPHGQGKSGAYTPPGAADPRNYNDADQTFDMTLDEFIEHFEVLSIGG